MSVCLPRTILTDEQATLIRNLLVLQPKSNGFHGQESKAPISFYIVSYIDKAMYLSLPFAFAASLTGKYLNNSNNYQTADYKFTKQLHDKQVPIMEEMRLQLKTYNSCTLRLPPGWGKTVLGALAASENGLLTCVLFHREIIGQAWYNTFRDFTTAKVWLVGDPTSKEIEKPDVILCLDTRVVSLPPEILKKIGFLIIDEAHCFCTPSHVKILLSFQPKCVLAETATLHRVDGMHTMITTMCGNHCVLRNNDKPFTVYKLQTGVEPTYKTGFDGKVDWASLSNNLARDEYRNSLILTLVALNLQHKILILTRTKEHATILYDNLKKRKYLPTPTGMQECSVDYMMGTKKEYEDSKVLVGTMSKIGTGFDEKAACSTFNGIRISLVILAASIKNVALLEQNVGRAFRAEKPNIIHLVDNNKTILNHWVVARAWYNKNMGHIVDMPKPIVWNFFTDEAAKTGKPRLIISS